MLGRLLAIFWSFCKVGLLGYGGGPGSVGLIQAEVVGTRHWMTPDQFAQVLAVGNALPGPLATKLAAWVGFRQAGLVGAVAGLAGVMVPSAVLILAAFDLINRYRQVSWVRGALTGVTPAVAALLVVLVLQLLPRPNHAALPAYGVGMAAFLALTVLRVPAVWVVLGALAVGGLFMRP